MTYEHHLKERTVFTNLYLRRNHFNQASFPMSTPLAASPLEPCSLLHMHVTATTTLRGDRRCKRSSVIELNAAFGLITAANRKRSHGQRTCAAVGVCDVDALSDDTVS